MRLKKKIGSEVVVDLDEAPVLTKAFFDGAEIFEGDAFIRRGPGRPRLTSPKEAVNLRLDQDVLAALRQHGPGWQTRVNEMLRAALGLSASGEN